VRQHRLHQINLIKSVDTRLKTGITESLSKPLIKIAQQLLISDKATFEQLTPTEQKLWTTFETADIYRFLTGEEDTVPEFQYNWTTVHKLQPLGLTNAPPIPANTAPPAAPPAPPPPPVSPPRSGTSPSPATNSPHSSPLRVPDQNNLHPEFSNHSLTLPEPLPQVQLQGGPRWSKVVQGGLQGP